MTTLLKDFKMLYDVNFFTVIRNARKIKNDFGVHDNTHFKERIRMFLFERTNISDITFSQLHEFQPIKLIVTATCLESMTPFTFLVIPRLMHRLQKQLQFLRIFPCIFIRNLITELWSMVIERLPMQCWPEHEISETMAFLVQSKNEYFGNEVKTPEINDIVDFISKISKALQTFRDESYQEKYKECITIINSNSISAFKELPTKCQITQSIWSAYFQTMSALRKED